MLQGKKCPNIQGLEILKGDPIDLSRWEEPHVVCLHFFKKE
jgi:hypothetical protein